MAGVSVLFSTTRKCTKKFKSISRDISLAQNPKAFSKNINQLLFFNKNVAVGDKKKKDHQQFKNLSGKITSVFH